MLNCEGCKWSGLPETCRVCRAEEKEGTHKQPAFNMTGVGKAKAVFDLLKVLATTEPMETDQPEMGTKNR